MAQHRQTELLSAAQQGISSKVPTAVLDGRFLDPYLLQSEAPSVVVELSMKYPRPWALCLREHYCTPHLTSQTPRQRLRYIRAAIKAIRGSIPPHQWFEATQAMVFGSQSSPLLMTVLWPCSGPMKQILAVVRSWRRS